MKAAKAELPADVMERLDDSLRKAVDEWNLIVGKYDERGRFPWEGNHRRGDKFVWAPEIQPKTEKPGHRSHYFDELAFRGKEIMTGMIKALSAERPYRGISFCCGHAPFKRRLMAYDDEAEARARLSNFRGGAWAFVDMNYGRFPEKDAGLLAVCKGCGIDARLIRHNLEDGFPPGVDEGSFDLATFQSVDDGSPVPSTLQLEYSVRALRKGGVFLAQEITARDIERNGCEGLELLFRQETSLGYMRQFEFGALYRKK